MIRHWSTVRVRPLPLDGSGLVANVMWPHPGEPGYDQAEEWFAEQFRMTVAAAADTFGERPVELSAIAQYGVWQ